eukprot:3133485-Pleurochrysis_carterae.AAC.1
MCTPPFVSILKGTNTAPRVLSKTVGTVVGVALGEEHNASKKRSEFRRWVIVRVLEVACFLPFDKVEELIDAGDGGDA